MFVISPAEFPLTHQACSTVGGVSVPAADRYVLLIGAFRPVGLRGRTAATHHCGCGGAGSGNQDKPSLDAGQAQVLSQSGQRSSGPDLSGCEFLEPVLSAVAGGDSIS